MTAKPNAIDPCPDCGLDRALVGRAHRCIPGDSSHLTAGQQKIMHKALRRALKIIPEPKPAPSKTNTAPKPAKPKTPAAKAASPKDEGTNSQSLKGTNSQSSKGTNAKSINTLKVAAYRDGHRADYNEYMRKLMRDRRSSQK